MRNIEIDWRAGKRIALAVALGGVISTAIDRGPVIVEAETGRPAATATRTPVTSTRIVIPRSTIRPGNNGDIIIENSTDIEVNVPPLPVQPAQSTPEIRYVPVPVTATPHPDQITLNRKAFDAALHNAFEEGKAAQAAVTTPVPMPPPYQPRPYIPKDRDRGWDFDWWSAIIGGAVVLGVSALAVTRNTVIERIHPHGPRGHTHPHP